MMEYKMEEDRNEGPPRKRLLTDPNPKKCFVTVSPESTVSSDSSSDRLAKKTRDLPNLSDCHSCAVRINYTNPRERLQPLDSMWRVVLLCKKCTKGVKSSELCPYCFSVVGDDKDYFKCLDCQHSIHKDCVAKFGSGPGFSVCVDCWVPDAVASSIGLGKRKRKKHNKQSCERAATLPESRVSVGEEVGKKFAAAEKASDNALKKSVIAKSAVELVKGDNAQIRCYSRRRASKKTSLMNSGNLGVPLIFYSRRRVKSGLKNSVTSNAPLIFYSRRRSSSKACSHVRECESFIVELSEGMDKHVSVSSSIGLKTSNCGSSAENSSSGNECQENDRVRFSLDPHRFLLKYHRMRKCNPRTSVFVKDSDCGSYIDSADLNAEDTSDTRDFRNGEICEIGDKNANRFLLKYKRSKAPACLAQ
ncbi:uncharacterized protein LOC111899504 [Lactuca sativa]|uniref:uncharacterized protein LOC111899504 n=1 Tax=Lactuca sativa TaxID=4236 RepID=UPI000CD8F8D9|nr:uncharacterized protein LOC111899504 [Lactuca sativa]